MPLASSRTGGSFVIRATSSEPLTTAYFDFEQGVVATISFKNDMVEHNLVSVLDQYPVSRSCFPMEFMLKSPHMNGIMIPEPWKDAAETFQAGCLIAVGAKGTGKSTFLRYMLNKIITSDRAVPRVKYLDLDPGQPEFGAPGQLSLTYHTTASLFSAAAYSPSSTILRSHWIGETSPKEDPEHYLACVDNLITTIHSHRDQSEPILVNTPGWIKGTGLELLHAIISRLFSKFETTVFTLGNVEVPGHSLPAQPNNGNSTDQQQKQVQPATTSAVDLRTINLISYFHRSHSSMSSAWQPRLTESSLRVSFSHFKVFIMRESLAYHDVPYAINGTLIAILSVDSEYLSQFRLLPHHSLTQIDHEEQQSRTPATHDDELQHSKLSVLETTELDPHHSHSLGLGIVHGIDYLTQSIYLITPINLQSLPQGHELVLATGSIELPSHLLINQQQQDKRKQSLQCARNESLGLPPYMSDRPGEGVGWQSWHVRRNIGRRIRK